MRLFRPIPMLIELLYGAVEGWADSGGCVRGYYKWPSISLLKWVSNVMDMHMLVSAGISNLHRFSG